MADELPVRPNDTEHYISLGRNGTGKTTAALYLLSLESWDRKPWLIVDSKGDRDIGVIGKMDGVRVLKYPDTNLAKNGLHIIRPRPDQLEWADACFWKIYQRNNVGVFVDEVFSMDKSDALDTLLMQGRSKHIPLRICSQRPAWMSRYCLSEPSFFQVFALNDRKDRQRIQEILPREQIDLDQRLPEYHSWWYEVKTDRAFHFSPVPPSSTILQTFRDRLQPKRIAI